MKRLLTSQPIQI